MNNIENLEENKNVYSLGLKDLDGEIWKDVVGFENEYQVSNYGRVKNKERLVTHYATETGVRILKSRIRKLSINGEGYHHVRLSKNNIVKTIRVHKMVADAFLNNSNHNLIINHKNFNKLDNRVENLEWMSRLENTRHYTEFYFPIKEIKLVYIETKNVYKFDFDINKEFWLDIKKYEGIYKISSFGRILSLSRKSFNGRTLFEKILKCSTDRDGYIIVYLFDNFGKKKNYKVHRLVAEYFIENKLSFPQVNHRDCNKKNNIVTNLEWVDDKTNKSHFSLSGHKLKGEEISNSKLKNNDILQIRELYKNKTSQIEIAKKFNINQNTVCKIIRRKIWRHV